MGLSQKVEGKWKGQDFDGLNIDWFAWAESEELEAEDIIEKNGRPS
jgi:hypothetical protein